MAKVICTELQKDGASGPNITLDTSKNVTCENNLQVDGNVTVTGTLPADKLTGTAAAINGSNITNLPAANLTGNLPAISGASLTNLPAGRSHPFRNLIINGAMNVAQRGSTSTSGSGYKTLDRWGWTAGGSGVDYITQAKVALTSSDTGPWEKGFRNCLKITNGDQSSSSGTANYAFVKYKVEAQDIAQSGWDYTSASSKITLSFWIKSSVAQNFHGNLKSEQATKQNYPFETGSLSANTWTKITKTIPGHANVDVNGTNSDGLSISIRAFTGTDWTDAGVSLNAWAAWASGTRVPAATSTWWDTNDATFAITGVQLEVGDTATEFEHIPFQDDLKRCQRYCYMIQSNSAGEPLGLVGYLPSTTVVYYPVRFEVPMKGGPTFSKLSTLSIRHISYDDSGSTDTGLIQDVYNANPTDNSVTAATLKFTVTGLGSAGTAGQLRAENAGWLKWEAEL